MSKIIHLRDDTDNIGEPVPWCGVLTFSCVDRPETVTCRECLETIITFAAECSKVLKGLDSAVGEYEKGIKVDE